MKELIPIFFKNIDKTQTTLNTTDIMSICFNHNYLPQNQTTVYSFLYLMLGTEVLRKIRRGLYEINWQKIEEIKNEL